MKLSGGVTGGQLYGSERDREDLVQLVRCPLCHAVRGVRCDNGMNAIGVRLVSPSSHTARYLAAVEAGLVPQMPGWPWTG